MKQFADGACTDAKKSLEDAKKDAKRSVEDAKKVAKKSVKDAQHKAKKGVEDAKKSVKDAKEEATQNQRELKQVYKGQVALIAIYHGEATKISKTKAKADVNVVMEQGDLRLERSRRASKVLRIKLNVSCSLLFNYLSIVCVVSNTNVIAALFVV